MLDCSLNAMILWSVLTVGVVIGWGLCALVKACVNDPSTQRAEDDLQAACLAGEDFELEAGLIVQTDKPYERGDACFLTQAEIDRSVQAFKSAEHERAPKGYVRGQAEPIYGCIDCNDPNCPQNRQESAS